MFDCLNEPNKHIDTSYQVDQSYYEPADCIFKRGNIILELINEGHETNGDYQYRTFINYAHYVLLPLNKGLD